MTENHPEIGSYRATATLRVDRHYWVLMQVYAE
jgi:hypothetical protein